IQPGIPLARAARVGCGGMTGVGAALNTAHVQPGSTVAVIGAGGVGLNVMQGAQLAGAVSIIAIDVNPSRLTRAGTFGATHTINSTDVDAVAAIRELTKGEGADFSFEADR